MTTILIIDDEKNVRIDLEKRLKNNYAVYTAASIIEAKKIIKAEKINYIIIDLHLDFRSECGGFEAYLYASRRQPWAKAIFLSAFPIEYVKYVLKNQLDNEFEIETTLTNIGNNYIQKGGEKNYIVAVLDKLGDMEGTVEKKLCFVIMPFSSSPSCNEEDWTEIFEKIIKPAVEESDFDYKCTRSNLLHGQISDHVIDNLNRANLVISDLTDGNPNVLYELGIRHTLRDPTVLISQNIAEIPFYLIPYKVISYGWKRREERERLMNDIKEAISSIEQSPDEIKSPVLRYLNPEPC